MCHSWHGADGPMGPSTTVLVSTFSARDMPWLGEMWYGDSVMVRRNRLILRAATMHGPDTMLLHMALFAGAHALRRVLASGA